MNCSENLDILVDCSRMQYSLLQISNHLLRNFSKHCKKLMALNLKAWNTSNNFARIAEFIFIKKHEKPTKNKTF